MVDLPTREELVEAAARAIAPIAWAALGTGDTLAQLNRRKASLRHAEMVLDAILPLVMRGPVEALGPLERWAGVLDEMIEMPGGEMVQSWSDSSIPPPNRGCATVGDLRRARTVRQWAEKIGGPR